ncbi:MAG: alpha/beta hydrolase [Rhodospirillales bacterium CG15_BIG_FIL_POST_REV_8_21_14_020_66_15]|nr:MAG: alpha/beta hydrolase [Rhodospirillales bacterium CG15_BIG_FIL_POST_REV_8_21_14_020_66_15]
MADPTPLPLAFTDTGAGRPLLILHGLFGSKRNWGAIAKVLSAHRRVLSLDLRNHGESPWDPVMTYPALAADVAHFIHAHGLGCPDVIGHSMGGKTAMTLALAHPELVRALCVVDIAPAPSPGTFIHYVEALRAMDLSHIVSRKDADALLAAAEKNPGIRAFLLQNLESGSGGYAWRVNLEALSAAMENLLDFAAPSPGRSYKGPTLFLAGGASNYIGPHHHGEIERLFPAARVEVLPGVGHWAHAEAPNLFLKHVTDFLGG